MIERIILLKKMMIFSVTRMEYLVVCEGERCAADLLNLFENFHKSKEEEVIRRVEADKLYQVSVLDYKQRWSLKAIRAGLLNLYSKPTIIKNLEWLCTEGYIRMSMVTSEGNENVIEGREVVFMEKKVQRSIDDFMEDLSRRPMPSEVLDLIEKRKENKKKIVEAVKNLTGGGCKKFDRGAVKNLTTNKINIDTVFIYKEEDKFFDLKRIEEEVDKIKEEDYIEIGEKISGIILDLWNNDFRQREYLIKMCGLVEKSKDEDLINELIGLYLLRFVVLFPSLKDKNTLLKRRADLFHRFVGFVFDSINFYNQSINNKKNGNSEYNRKGNGERDERNGSKQYTKAERQIMEILGGK